jgi:hypothetical protein
MGIKVYRDEPLQFEVGEKVKLDRTGVIGTVIAVDEKELRIRLEDGEETSLGRASRAVSRPDDPDSVSPNWRTTLRNAGVYRLHDRILITSMASVGEALIRSIALCTTIYKSPLGEASAGRSDVHDVVVF